VQADLGAEVLGELPGGKRVPIVERKDDCAARKALSHVHDRGGQHDAVRVVAVDEDDLAEAAVREREDEVLDEGGHRGSRDERHACVAAVIAGDAVGQRRRDERADPRGDADAHLRGENRVRPERRVRPVLLCSADGNDDLRAPLQLLLDVAQRALGEKDSRRGHARRLSR
jgi:hypothetical protein